MAPVTMSLSKCLEAASMKEVMKDQNAYQCGICKKEEEATKTLQIYKAPPILIMTL